MRSRRLRPVPALPPRPRLFGRKANWYDATGFECSLSSLTELSAVGKSASTGSNVSATVPTMSQWVHLTFAYAGSTATVFANGVQVASGMVTPVADNGKELTIGALSGSEHVKGMLDEFRLKPGTVSADWVKAEYDQAGTAFLANGGVKDVGQDVPSVEGVQFYVD